MKTDIGNEQQIVVLCRRCGRKLLDEVSKERGFGPACFRMWKKEHSSQIALFTVKRSDDDGGK